MTRVAFYIGCVVVVVCVVVYFLFMSEAALLSPTNRTATLLPWKSSATNTEKLRFYNGDRLAVICYIPKSLDEVRLFISLLYGSWRYLVDHEETIRKSKKLTNDIDLYVFSHPGNVDDLKSVCEIYDVSKTSDGRQHCWIVPQDFELNIGYGPLNSFVMFNRTDIDDILKPYKYLLRTDYDVFLTPALYVWKPKYHVVSGKGGYSVDFNRKRLKSISRKLGMQHRGVHNVGSTWFGETNLFIQLSKLTIEMTTHMFCTEFQADLPGLEKIPLKRNVNGVWPEWWRPVSLLYGAELALNHLIPDFREDYKEELDSSSCDQAMTVWKTPHIHCWHNDCEFQKFKFIKHMKQIVESRDTLPADIVHRLVENVPDRQVPEDMTLQKYSTFIAWNSMGRHLRRWFQ